MRLKEILSIERYPFEADILNDDVMDEGIGDASMEHCIRFLLYLRYLNRFYEELELEVSVPIPNILLNRIKVQAFKEKEDYFMDKEAHNRILFQDIMKKAGWSIERVNWQDDDESIALLDGECSRVEWDDMVLEMPELYRDAGDAFEYSCVTLCWNFEVAGYLHFREKNKKRIQEFFSEGDELINQILDEISDPLQISTGLTYRNLMDDRYVMGFYEGRNDTYALSFLNLHYHFGINVVVLKMLLDYAGSLFLMEDL